jgi:uncharacterized membrane protein
VKVVTMFLGTKALYIIVVIMTSQNYYTKGAEKMATFAESKTHEWR